MSRARLLALGAALLLVSPTACDDEHPLAGRLADARSRWADHGPPDYSMVLVRGCFCGPEALGPVTVAVVGGTVVSRTYTEDGRVVPEPFEDSFPDVEELFEVAADAVRRAYRVDAEFDPDLGFPVRLSIDYAENVADDEIEYRVQRLTPGPPAD